MWICFTDTMSLIDREFDHWFWAESSQFLRMHVNSFPLLPSSIINISQRHCKDRCITFPRIQLFQPLFVSDSQSAIFVHSLPLLPLLSLIYQLVINLPYYQHFRANWLSPISLFRPRGTPSCLFWCYCFASLPADPCVFLTFHRFQWAVVMFLWHFLTGL